MGKKVKVDRGDGKDWYFEADEKQADNGPVEGMREVTANDMDDIEALLNRRGKKLK